MYEQASTDVRQGWGQFSLRTLMVAITVFCVLFALMATPFLLAIVMAAAYMGLTGMLVVAIWEGRGWIRAFAVGAALPHLVGYFSVFTGGWPMSLIVLGVVFTFMSCVSGTAAAAFQGALARRGGKLPEPRVPVLRRLFTNAGCE